MSDNGIKEKIQKIRQELENFSLSDQNSFDIFYRKTEPNRAEFESSSILNLAIPEESKLSPILGSQKFNRDFFKINSEAELKEADFNQNSMKNDTNFFQSIKEQEISKHNKLLLVNLNETRAYYVQVLAEKDELISKYREKIAKDEYDLVNLKKGFSNIEELKDSTRKLINESDRIEKERDSLLKENRVLKEKLLNRENEISRINEDCKALQSQLEDRTSANAKSLTKIKELEIENEFLNKALNQGKKNPKNSSYSPAKKLSASSRFAKSGSFPRRGNISSEGEKTERKSTSPLIRGKAKRNLSTDHLTTCKIVKELLNVLSLSSPDEIIPLIITLNDESKSIKSKQKFFEKIQSLVTQNSPPGSFKTSPNSQACLSWVKRLIKEYFEIKSGVLPDSHSKILNVLRAGLSTNSVEDIPRAISKLLVENEKLLSHLNRVRQVLKCGCNTSFEDMEKELRLRVN